MQNIPADVKAKLAYPSAAIKSKTHIIDFLFGGKAKFSLKSLKTGKSFPYITRKKHGYIAVHNYTKDAAYLGALTKAQGTELKFKLYELQTGTPSALAFAWFCRHFTEYDKIELWHQGECSMCGRALTDPKSIERGIGPVCYEALSRGELPF